jgi:hypothetical protein
MAKESQLLTSLELKTASQKSRISEMEGSLNMAHENSAKIRKQAMIYQEKIAALNNEVISFVDKQLFILKY